MLISNAVIIFFSSLFHHEYEKHAYRYKSIVQSVHVTNNDIYLLPTKWIIESPKEIQTSPVT